MKKEYRIDVPEAEDIPQFVKVLDDLATGNNVFLVGGAGTGKTTLAEKISYSLFGRQENDGEELPYVIVNCNQWTSPIDLIGGQTIEGYKEGRLIRAWREGKVLILEEMPKLDANTAGILNDALAKSAKDGAIIFNGKSEPVKKHPMFGCVATGNVLGKSLSSSYVGNNVQDASLLDRFSGCIYRIGFNEKLERHLVYPAVVDICLKLRKSILRYEGKGADDDDTEDIMTLRTMMNMQRTYELEMKRELGMVKNMPNGKTLKDALESYMNTMSQDKARKVAAEVNLEAFYNSYKGKAMRDVFQIEYKRRQG